jgi:chromosome segregation ATPase
MDNLENVSDKLKIERLSNLVKSLYENIDDLKSKLDKKNITQSNKAFDELYEKHRNLEEDYEALDLKLNESSIKLNIAENIICGKNEGLYKIFEKYKELKKDFDEIEKDHAEALDELDQTTFTLEKIKATLDISEKDYRKLMDSYMEQRKEIEELKDSKSKLSQAEETIASYQKTYEKLRKENETLIAQSSYDKETIASYQKTYDTLRKELEESNNTQSSLRKIYDNLYDTYRSDMLEHDNLKEFLKENLNHTQAVYEELYKLRKEKAILENNAAKNERVIDGLKFEIECNNHLLESDRRIILRNITTRKELVETMKKQEKEIENLVNTILGMENELYKKDYEMA